MTRSALIYERYSNGLQKKAPTKHQATEIIGSLIEKIVVSPTGQRGKSDVVLHGALASILAYANDTAQSGVVSNGVGRVLLVAGAGFEPATFRL